MASEATVGIGVGHGVQMYIAKDDNLYVEIDGVRVCLGRATKTRFETLTEYVQRLAVHALAD
jgi:hypothetical protein